MGPAALKQCWSLIPQKLRRSTILYLPLSLLPSLLELISLTALFPLLSLASGSENPTAKFLQTTFSYLRIEDKSVATLALGLCFVLILLTREVLLLAFNWYRTKFFGNIQKELSTQLLGAYLAQDFGFFLTRYSTELEQNVGQRVDQIHTGIIQPLLSLFARIISIVLFTVALLSIYPLAAMASIFVLGVSHLLLSQLYKPKLKHLCGRLDRISQDRYRTAKEIFQGIREAKTRQGEDLFLAKHSAIAEEMKELQTKIVLLEQTPAGILRFIFLAVIVAILVAASLKPIDGWSLPLLTTFVILFGRLLPRIQGVVQSFTQVSAHHSTFVSLLNDLALPLKETSLKNAPELIEAPFQELSCRDLTFRYNDERSPVLDKVDVTFEKGSSTAILGATGAGKTTLLDLIAGLLRPSEGQVLVDGETLIPKLWGSALGYVSQTAFFSERSIAQNIAFGVPEDEIDSVAISKAANLAGLDEFIENELSNAYDTILGGSGLGLSGGQKQRLALARALYHKPQLLLLDEATSNLDLETERLILDRLLAQDFTIILVTHRLSSAERCDRCLVLSDGKVAGFGAVSKLQEECPAFLQLLTITGDVQARSMRGRALT